jgi:hypothetical protein
VLRLPYVQAIALSAAKIPGKSIAFAIVLGVHLAELQLRIFFGEFLKRYPNAEPSRTDPAHALELRRRHQGDAGAPPLTS